MLLETVAVAAEEVSSNRITQIITDSDPVIKLTLLILLFFSVVSWAIIFMKFTQLKQARAAVRRFLQLFTNAPSIDALLKKGRLPDGPAHNVLQSGVAQLRDGNRADVKLRVHSATQRAATVEVEQMEHYLPFLATTASATPFIGLFGTCWGILNAFFELSSAGSSGIQVVGPRIAEALFATAVGLAAAIPAVVFYNFFMNKIRLLSRSMEQFTHDLCERIDTEYFAA